MEKNKISTYVYNAIVILCLVCGICYVANQFLYLGGGEVTDNARVCQNIVPQNCRVLGFIREVRFSLLMMLSFVFALLKQKQTLFVPNKVRKAQQVVSTPQKQASVLQKQA